VKMLSRKSAKHLLRGAIK